MGYLDLELDALHDAAEEVVLPGDGERSHKRAVDLELHSVQRSAVCLWDFTLVVDAVQELVELLAGDFEWQDALTVGAGSLEEHEHNAVLACVDRRDLLPVLLGIERPRDRKRVVLLGVHRVEDTVLWH